jgi:diguanylate cyclase (GGDEF)-like protein
LEQISKLLAQHGISDFLRFTQTFAALIDQHGTLLEWNPAFGQMLDRLPTARLLPDLLTAASRPAFKEMIQAGKPRSTCLQLLYSEGRYDFLCLLSPLPDQNFLFFAEPAWESRDDEMTRLTNNIEKLKHTLEIKKIELEAVLVQADEVSHTDSLTFLANRKQIIADLQREVMACERYRKPLTIFMMDVDHFKKVNDTYGHAAGDLALREMSIQMGKGIRQLDKLGRYGGEEFLVLLPATSIKSGIKLADRLLQITREMPINLENDQSIHITVSIGIAQYRVGRENWDDLLRRADKALYQSKANGRDQWTVSNLSDNGIISSRSPRAK